MHLFFSQLVYFLTSALFLFPFTCFSQSNSFQVVLDSVGYRMQDIALNEDGKAIIIMRKHPNNSCYLLPFEGVGGPVQGIKIPNISPAYVLRTEYYKDRAIFLAYAAGYPDPMVVGGKSVIVNIDLTNNEKWSKYLNGYVLENKFSIDENGDIVIANTPHNHFHDDLYGGHASVLELYKLDETGDMVWKKGALLLDSLFHEFPYLRIMDMALDKDDNIYLLGTCGDLFGPEYQMIPFIIKFDPAGHPLLLKTLKVENIKLRFNEIEITSSGVLLLSHAPNNPRGYNSGIYRDSYVRLLKLDFDLNFLWGKKYSGENFPYYSAGIKEKPDGNLLMTHATFGAFPVVLTELDPFGNILSEKGYPNYEPQVAPFSDGSFLMTSQFNYNDAGETFYQPVVARTDINGEIEGCENYPACIIAENYTIGMGTINYDTFNVPDLEDFDALVQPIDFSFSEFCGFPPAPQPDFYLPDSLCLGATAITSNTQNQMANARQWHLTGPGVDSVLMDSFDFVYTFENPGEYILAQTVWALGCAYPFERVITVLSPLEAEIYPNHICPDMPNVISVETNRPAVSFTWSNGQTTPTFYIQSSGSYTVTVSDGACSASDTAEITVVGELLGGLPALNLPPDTTVCFSDLPFGLAPGSAFTDSFFLARAFMPAQSFQLTEAGRYRIGAEVFGCIIWEDFDLVVDCQADVYVPNAFSPNGDGINDLFRPYGTDFEILEMIIYDRWGGELFRMNGQSAAWEGKDSEQGVYAFKIKYRDMLNGQEKELTGEFVLIR